MWGSRASPGSGLTLLIPTVPIQGGMRGLFQLEASTQHKVRHGSWIPIFVGMGGVEADENFTRSGFTVVSNASTIAMNVSGTGASCASSPGVAHT